MKMIIAILRDADNDPVSHALTSANFRVTTIASTGGFLKRGQTTLFVGTEDDQVDSVVAIVKKNCAPATEPSQKRGIIFVLNVDEYVHF
ncbi:MAG TPA: cyclic-di-AMP receptor [Anaerolineaceae bacterium]|nr:cyclic-di-AMP receptor [Anaerolineaceae bacterium]